MSSCQNEYEDVREFREAEVRTAAKQFLRQVVVNLCAPEGLSGHVDLAFNVDRKKIISEVLIELGEEMKNE